MMARMIPPEFNETNNSVAERKLYYTLNKSFNDDWIIFHSYTIEGRNKQNHLIDAEIDFLLLNKDFGIIIIEVKGGQIKCSDGVWYQNSIAIKDPYWQAVKNKNILKSYLKQQFHADPPIAIAHAVFFIDDYDFDEKGVGLHKYITLTGQNINFLYDSIVSIMKAQKKPEYSIDLRMFRAIEKSLMPIFEYGSSIQDRFSQEKKCVFSLTEQQCELLIFISEHKKALIKGCAGSGKTVMAVKKAKELASNGKQVIFLCYNLMLADNLASELSTFPNIRAITYNDFCVDELKKAGSAIEPYGDYEKFYKIILPTEFLKLLSSRPLKFDAVIVDEGQDFREDYWIAINDLVKDEGYFYIFYDPDQNIFQSELKLPDLGIPFLLNKNCRNTKKIFKALKPLASMEIRIDEESPDGSDIIDLEFNDATELCRKLSQILHSLITDQGLKESQIAILGNHRLDHTSIGQNFKIGKYSIIENGIGEKNAIQYFTCMKFKGLEKDVIILLDYNDERWSNPATRYTGISRAKHLLYILRISNKNKN